MESAKAGEEPLANRLLAPLETLANVQHLLRDRLTKDAELQSLLSMGDQALTEMITAVHVTLKG